MFRTDEKKGSFVPAVTKSFIRSNKVITLGGGINKGNFTDDDDDDDENR